MPDLRNPGPDAPRVLSFDTIPHPLEFLKRGGVPGVEYIYLKAEEQADAQESGWNQIIGVPYFRVNGHAATLMARGEPIPGAQPGSVKCNFWVSKALKAALNPPAQPKAAVPEKSVAPTKETTPPVPQFKKDYSK